MSNKGDTKDLQRGSSARALQFSPTKGNEPSLITSSVRKKKREPGTSIPPPAAKRLNTEGPQSSNKPIEELASPPLRRNKDKEPEHEVKESFREAPDGAEAAKQARTASPPRPPPELPPGVPAPPIPQGRIQDPGPGHEPLSPGPKPKGMIQTLFSPMFHLFQPGETQSPADATEEQESHSRRGERRASPKRKITKSRTRSRSPEEKEAAGARESPATRTAAGSDGAGPDELRSEAVVDGGRRNKGRAKLTAEKAVGPGGSAASEGASSSTDGESETCLTGRPGATVSSSGGEEDTEGGSESDVGEEVYVADASNDLEDDAYEFDPYAFIKSLPPLEQCAPSWRRILLPKQTRQCKRKTLVLDLDETLVHSTLDSSDATDFQFEVSYNNRSRSVNVRQRPHLQQFLKRCADLFEVVVFTASQKLYAEQLLNVLDPTRKLIRHRIYRDSCLFVEGNYLKDLSVLGRDLAHTIIVDNSPQAFGFQLANGVPIESWYDDESDTELMRLLPFLEFLVDVPDVRPVIINAFKLHTLVDQATAY